jgi:hypothetical protein
MIAGDMQAMTGVSEMARKLMSACEDAMAIINCANTEGDEHDTATAAFDEAASSLGELGFVYARAAAPHRGAAWPPTARTHPPPHAPFRWVFEGITQLQGAVVEKRKSLSKKKTEVLLHPCCI